MKNKMKEIIFAAILIIGIIVCTICDIALFKSYTWSLVPISSIIFAWVALLPIKRHGKKGFWGSLAILFVCIMLYLYVLSTIIKDNELIFSIGSKIAAISIVYLICIFIIFKIFKKRKFSAISASLFLGIPICMFINYNLSEMFNQPLIDLWDILAILTLLILSIIFFVYGLNTKKK